MPEYDEMEKSALRRVCQKFSVAWDDIEELHEYDQRICQDEMMQVFPKPVDIGLKPLGVRLHFWSWSWAKRQLLDEAKKLGGHLMVMLRYNAGKAPVTLIPTSFVRALLGVACPRFTLAVAEVLDFGRNKYAAHNWRKGGPWMDVLASGFRHYQWYRSGETHDSESELHHLAHFGCNIAFLLEFVEQETPTDDRFFVEKLWPTYRAENGDWLDSAVIEFLRFQDGGGAENLRQGLLLLASYYELLVTDPEPSSGTVDSYLAMQESIAA